jgi:hypothetical protein
MANPALRSPPIATINRPTQHPLLAHASGNPITAPVERTCPATIARASAAGTISSQERKISICFVADQPELRAQHATARISTEVR